MASNRNMMPQRFNGSTKISQSGTIDGVSTNMLVSLQAKHVDVKAGSTKQKKRRKEVPESQQNATAVRTILHDISVTFTGGTLCAIMGSSGGGKSTLMNVLSGRVKSTKNFHVEGEINFTTDSQTTINGSNAVRSAYLTQDDSLDAELSIKETLLFAASLRQKHSTSQQLEQVVADLIETLRLEKAASTLIRHCSGGEKRRTSLAIQLLGNPDVLLLDEPTTGLDATSAIEMVKMLKGLALQGRTVIITLHQPSIHVWNMLDQIVLLTKGHCVYASDRAECMQYLSELGLYLPPLCSPPEYLIDVSSVDKTSEKALEDSLSRIERLKEAWARTSAAQESETHDEHRVTLQSQANHYPALPSPHEIATITRREILIVRRDLRGLAASFIGALLLGLAVGFIFMKLDGSLAGVRSRFGAIWSACVSQAYIVLLYECYRFSADVKRYDRERNDGVVTSIGYLISRRLSRIPEDVGSTMIYTVSFYYLSGLQPRAGHFFTFWLTTYLLYTIAISIATFAVALTKDFAGSSVIGNLIFVWQTFSSGYFIPVSSLPVWLRWAKWSAYYFYAFAALCINELSGRYYDCDGFGSQNDSNCSKISGNNELRGYGLPTSRHWMYIAVLPAFILLNFSFATFLLWKPSSKQSSGSLRDIEPATESADKSYEIDLLDTISPIDIRLENYAIGHRAHVLKSGRLHRTHRVFLQPLNASFPSGTLNIVIGPSGAGKSTFLSGLYGTLPSSIKSKYDITGRLFFNNTAIDEREWRSIVALSVQADKDLIPHLTVKETLNFAASLRLPRSMSKQEKQHKADTILTHMGLSDCANTLVGSDSIQGISGGERRRLSLGIQLLSDPKVLLVDEATSGLDNFHARAITKVLRQLANSGRIVIMVAHQASNEIWSQCDNALVLAHGGVNIYSGPCNKMTRRLAQRGYECPSDINPADFALTIASTAESTPLELTDVDNLPAAPSSYSGWETPTPTQDRITDTADTESPATDFSKRRSNSTLATSGTLLHRTIINYSRQGELLVSLLMQVIVVAIFLIMFFCPLKHDVASIQVRMGLIQQILPIYFTGMIWSIATYPQERKILYRELDDGVYAVEAFLLQWTLVETVLCAVGSFLFSISTVFIIGLPRTAEMFFTMLFACICLLSCGQSIGLMFRTFFNHDGFAVHIASTILGLANLMGGIMSIKLPGFLRGINYVSPLKYATISLTTRAFRNQSFSCPNTHGDYDKGCQITQGSQVLRLYGLDKKFGLNLALLGLLALIYRILSYVVLKDRTRRRL